MDIEFFDELPGTRPDQDEYFDFAEVLKNNPGKWAVLPRGNRSQRQIYNQAAAIKSGNYRAFKVGYEAATRKGNVYVRYVGEDGGHK